MRPTHVKLKNWRMPQFSRPMVSIFTKANSWLLEWYFFSNTFLSLFLWPSLNLDVIWLKLNRMKRKLQDRFSNGILWQFFGIWMSISTSISRKDKLKYYNFAHCASAASSKGNHLGHALNGKVIWELWHSSSFSKEKTSPPFEAFHNGLNSFLKEDSNFYGLYLVH